MLSDIIHMSICPVLRVNGNQILHYDPDVKKMYLRIIVTNAQSPTSPGDDAHEAMLNVTIPDELVFSAVSVSNFLSTAYPPAKIQVAISIN